MVTYPFLLSNCDFNDKFPYYFKKQSVAFKGTTAFVDLYIGNFWALKICNSADVFRHFKIVLYVHDTDVRVLLVTYLGVCFSFVKYVYNLGYLSTVKHWSGMNICSPNAEPGNNKSFVWIDLTFKFENSAS